MEEKKSRILLYRLRSEIRRKSRGMFLESFHYRYINDFLKKHSASLYLCGWLLLVTVCLELLLPIICHIYVARYAELLVRSTFLISLIALFVGVLIYLVSNFWFIKNKATLEIKLINDLRRKWFLYFLSVPAAHVKQNDSAKLMAKITYHFSLLRMGLSNSLVGSAKWLLTISGLIFVTFFVDTKLFVLVLVSIPLHILLFFIGYYIATVYVSKEATLYTEIIRLIARSMSELKFLEKHNLRKKTLDYLDSVVELDLFFRVRRNLWMEYGFRCLFAIVLLGAGIAYFVQLHYPTAIDEYNLSSFIAPGIIIAYLIRLCYIALRVGLYSIPLKLGIILSVPDANRFLIPPKENSSFNILEIFANKVKLLKNSSYLKKVKISLKKNSRVLITGQNGSGKSFLASLIAGEAADNLAAWMVKKDKERMTYMSWKKYSPNGYYISPRLDADRTIGEILTGLDRRDISDNDIEKIYETLGNHPSFNSILNSSRSIASTYIQNRMGATDIFLLQAAFCLINKPDIITVDNLWLDLNYDIINDTLKVMDEQLENSAIIFTALKSNSIISYEKTYKIKTSSVEAEEENI